MHICGVTVKQHSAMHGVDDIHCSQRNSQWHWRCKNRVGVGNAVDAADLYASAVVDAGVRNRQEGLVEFVFFCVVILVLLWMLLFDEGS